MSVMLGVGEVAPKQRILIYKKKKNIISLFSLEDRRNEVHE